MIFRVKAHSVPIYNALKLKNNICLNHFFFQK